MLGVSMTMLYSSLQEDKTVGRVLHYFQTDLVKKNNKEKHDPLGETADLLYRSLEAKQPMFKEPVFGRVLTDCILLYWSVKPIVQTR